MAGTKAGATLRANYNKTSTQEWHELWRRKIRTGSLINRLRNHVYGNVSMSKTQVAAAIALLRKTMPDVASIEHSGGIEHRAVARVPHNELNFDEWKQKYLPQTIPQAQTPETSDK
jgi:hypothetical protein